MMLFRLGRRTGMSSTGARRAMDDAMADPNSRFWKLVTSSSPFGRWLYQLGLREDAIACAGWLAEDEDL